MSSNSGCMFANRTGLSETTWRRRILKGQRRNKSNGDKRGGNWRTQVIYMDHIVM